MAIWRRTATPPPQRIELAATAAVTAKTAAAAAAAVGLETQTCLEPRRYVFLNILLVF